MDSTHGPQRWRDAENRWENSSMMNAWGVWLGDIGEALLTAIPSR